MCLNFCKKVLKIEQANEDATYMLANLLLMRNETEGAMDVFIKLLEKDPTNFKILANLIDLLRRAGQLQKA